MRCSLIMEREVCFIYEFSSHLCLCRSSIENDASNDAMQFQCIIYTHTQTYLFFDQLSSHLFMNFEGNQWEI